jgi:hypothetical protein
MPKSLLWSSLAAGVLYGGLVPVVLAQPATRPPRSDAAPGSDAADALDFRPRNVISPRRPIVDAPVLGASEVTDQVAPNELVLGVVIGTEARAYPINMLTGPSREIINDQLGGRAIAATW